MRISVESRLNVTPRVLQAASLFDLEVGGFSRLTWDVELPLAEKPWNIGLITGPSGCGKSTVAGEFISLPGSAWARTAVKLSASL
jgi:type II secretory ATPase GspE/PulE/Tfp pilus assembly ATPase PilB-like protein